MTTDTKITTAKKTHNDLVREGEVRIGIRNTNEPKKETTIKTGHDRGIRLGATYYSF